MNHNMFCYEQHIPCIYGKVIFYSDYTSSFHGYRLLDTVLHSPIMRLTSTFFAQ
jgi:hypothetical protein